MPRLGLHTVTFTVCPFRPAFSSPARRVSAKSAERAMSAEERRPVLQVLFSRDERSAALKSDDALTGVTFFISFPLRLRLLLLFFTVTLVFRFNGHFATGFIVRHFPADNFTPASSSVCSSSFPLTFRCLSFSGCHFERGACDAVSYFAVKYQRPSPPPR